ncbi:DUF1440 domain-containing protein [Spongiimicrobium salis]|uniref:DUF1440 domain-containing protein n=1 Tax=Spongiimicrobium salis TaxID=1667022 RepID=UPI00374D0F3F
MINSVSLFDFTKSSSSIKTLLWSGLIAGILDAIAGVIVYYFYFDLNPLQVLQFIAAGVYGPEAINGGISMILAGLFFHFLIAYVVAIIYFFAHSTLAVLRGNVIVIGLFYGLGIWLVMNLLILPYTNIPKSPFDLGLALIGIAWHMVLVGLPIALITSNYLPKKEML